MYLRWFLFAVRYHMGRSTFEVPEYLKKWAVSEFGVARDLREEENRTAEETSTAEGGPSRNRTSNVFATLGLDEEELGPGF